MVFKVTAKCRGGWSPPSSLLSASSAQQLPARNPLSSIAVTVDCVLELNPSWHLDKSGT